jgi:hypothetical protein
LDFDEVRCVLRLADEISCLLIRLLRHFACAEAEVTESFDYQFVRVHCLFNDAREPYLASQQLVMASHVRFDTEGCRGMVGYSSKRFPSMGAMCSVHWTAARRRF